MMDLTREYYEAVRDCTPEDCGDCILRPATNRACYTVDVDPGKEARMILGLMDERDALRARVAEAERLLSLVQNGACEAAHHPKEDRHRIGEPCPVDARIRAWLHPSAGGGHDG